MILFHSHVAKFDFLRISIRCPIIAIANILAELFPEERKLFNTIALSEHFLDSDAAYNNLYSIFKKSDFLEKTLTTGGQPGKLDTLYCFSRGVSEEFCIQTNAGSDDGYGYAGLRRGINYSLYFNIHSAQRFLKIANDVNLYDIESPISGFNDLEYVALDKRGIVSIKWTSLNEYDRDPRGAFCPFDFPLVNFVPISFRNIVALTHSQVKPLIEYIFELSPKKRIIVEGTKLKILDVEAENDW